MKSSGERTEPFTCRCGKTIMVSKEAIVAGKKFCRRCAMARHLELGRAKRARDREEHAGA